VFNAEWDIRVESLEFKIGDSSNLYDEG